MKLETEDYPSVFWKWNDRLTAKNVRAGVEKFKRDGIRSFLIHPLPDHFRKEDFFGGMTTPYLSDAFFAAVRVAVKRAAELDLQVWLYDEGGWPSGRAGGLIVKKWPHLRARVMTPGGPEFSTPERTDLLNPETTRRFIELTHERYREVVGEYFGSVIPGFFTDEPDVPGQVGTDRIPWTADMAEVFKDRTGEDLEPLLPCLFGRGRDEKARQARIRYVDVWTSLFAERFFDPLRSFCHQHSLLLVGHLLGDQSLRGHARCAGDFFKIIRSLDEPGIDVIWGQMDTVRSGAFFPSFASSALQRPGQRCWSEPFAAFGTGLTVQEMKRLCDLQLLQGINKFAPMYIQMSRRDGRWVGTGTRGLDFAPDAGHYADLEGYLAASGRRLRQGQLFRPIRAPYPIRELWAQYGRSASDPFNRLAKTLIRRNIGFVFDAEAKEDRIEVLARKFQTLWRFPQRVESSPRVRWTALTTPDGRPELFCVNAGSRSGKVRMKPAGITWTLAPGESRFLSLDDPQPDPELRQTLVLKNWEIRMLCQWKLLNGTPTPVEKNGRAWKACPLGSWSSILGAWFSGSASYRTTFQWKDGEHATLDLGRVHFAAECRLNGKSLGRAAWSPFRFSLDAALRQGANTLEVTIHGSLANLMRDPCTRKELKARGWWNVYLDRASGLEENRLDAGLHGPVKILRPISS